MSQLFKSDEEFRAHLALLYNESIELLDGTPEPIIRLIEYGDVVEAVWADPDEPGGIDFLCLKGIRLLREMATGKRLGRGLRITVLPCLSYELATEVKEVFGERVFDA